MKLTVWQATSVGSRTSLRQRPRGVALGATRVVAAEVEGRRHALSSLGASTAASALSLLAVGVHTTARPISITVVGEGGIRAGEGGAAGDRGAGGEGHVELTVWHGTSIGSSTYISSAATSPPPIACQKHRSGGGGRKGTRTEKGSSADRWLPTQGKHRGKRVVLPRFQHLHHCAVSIIVDGETHRLVVASVATVSAPDRCCQPPHRVLVAPPSSPPSWEAVSASEVED